MPTWGENAVPMKRSARAHCIFLLDCLAPQGRMHSAWAPWGKLSGAHVRQRELFGMPTESGRLAGSDLRTCGNGA